MNKNIKNDQFKEYFEFLKENDTCAEYSDIWQNLILDFKDSSSKKILNVDILLILKLVIGKLMFF